MEKEGSTSNLVTKRPPAVTAWRFKSRNPARTPNSPANETKQLEAMKYVGEKGPARDRRFSTGNGLTTRKFSGEKVRDRELLVAKASWQEKCGRRRRL